MKIFNLSCLFLLGASITCAVVAEASSTDTPITVYGEYLYWKVVQDQVPYAAVLPGGPQGVIDQIGSGSTKINEKLLIKDSPFKYSSGFRLGIDYVIPCSAWDVELAWTRLYERKGASVSDAGNGVIPLNIPIGVIFGFINRDPSDFRFANEAKSHWKFSFDTIDLQLGRECCWCGVDVHPFIGLKAASIRQTQSSKYLGFTIDGGTIVLGNKRNNDFRGIGPSLGFDLAWEFCPQWSLSGGVSSALLYGKFDVNEWPTIDLGVPVVEINLKDAKKYRLRPMVDAYLGLDWTCCVCGYPLSVGAAYEMQYWWNQWQAPASFESTIFNGGTSPQGDLMLYGLTLRAAIAF